MPFATEEAALKASAAEAAFSYLKDCAHLQLPSVTIHLISGSQQPGLQQVVVTEGA